MKYITNDLITSDITIHVDGYSIYMHIYLCVSRCVRVEMYMNECWNKMKKLLSLFVCIGKRTPPVLRLYSVFWNSNMNLVAFECKSSLECATSVIF